MPPSSQNFNPFDFFMWSEVEREVTNALMSPWPPSDVITDLDMEVIIHACKKFWSWIEAVMEATGVFIK
jgi:hypothetical protein